MGGLRPNQVQSESGISENAGKECENITTFKGLGRLYSDEEIEFFRQMFGQFCQGPGHETPAEQPPFVYIDPDNQEFTPKPPNERSIGISSEPDRDLGQEVEV